MMIVCTSQLHRTCLTGSRENVTMCSDAQTRRCFSVALSLRLVVLLSLLRPTVAHVPRAGVRQRCVDVASRTIQADVVLEGRVERVLSDPVMVVRLLAVFKGRQMRRQATSGRRLRMAVDFRSLADRFTVAGDDDADVDHLGCIASPTSLAAGARLIMFLRHRDTDAMLTYYVTSGGRRRQRKVDLYRMSSLPAAVDANTRQTARKYSKRRNGEFNVK